jgi:aminoglycoside phosphotransferase (APT) family kinase protein
VAFVLKHFGPTAAPDWRYALRVGAALRAQGWPTPEPVEEPLIRADGGWVLLHRLPGEPGTPADEERPAEQRARGRLLAELHAAAAATGITEQRRGFSGAAELVADPELEHWLRVHEATRPQQGRVLRACRDAVAQWFAAHPDLDAPRSVIHGDFAPQNLLFHDGRLTGVLDFEASHYTFQVADFALSWRGNHDNVLRGYHEVRALSEVEWQLVRPTFWAWMFIGVKDLLATCYGSAAAGDPPPDLRWQLTHLRRRSRLLEEKSGEPALALPFED